MPVWAKFGRFWAQNPIFWAQGVKILVPSYRDSNETPFSCWKHWSVRLQLAARGENVLFWPKNLDIWAKKSIFCMVIAIFVNGAYNHYNRGYNFPIRTTPKQISVSKLNKRMYRYCSISSGQRNGWHLLAKREGRGPGQVVWSIGNEQFEIHQH